MFKTTCVTFFILLVVGCRAAPSSPTQPAPGRQADFKNTVVSLTFDDGDADNYAVREVLAKNRLHATFYIVSGFIGKDGYMTESELRGLYEDGNEIGGHSLSHLNLTEIHGADVKHEICQGRLDLLAYGFKVTSFAYPFGLYNDEAKQAVIQCGYNSARSALFGPESIPPKDRYVLLTMEYVVADTPLSKMLRYIREVEDTGGGWVIFILHHICDGCDTYAIAPDTFVKFAHWLGEQQANGLMVRTVGEVIGGELQPGMAP